MGQLCEMFLEQRFSNKNNLVPQGTFSYVRGHLLVVTTWERRLFATGFQQVEDREAENHLIVHGMPTPPHKELSGPVPVNQRLINPVLIPHWLICAAPAASLLRS